jgi:hypothetical protein
MVLTYHCLTVLHPKEDTEAALGYLIRNVENLQKWIYEPLFGNGENRQEREREEKPVV